MFFSHIIKKDNYKRKNKNNLSLYELTNKTNVKKINKVND